MPLYNFKKHIILPSGGISYDPYVWLSPITKELALFDLDSTYNDSQLERIVTIIQAFAQLPENILNMYVDDIYYLWLNILSLDLQKDTELYEVHMCRKCEHLNKILIDFSTIDYNMFSKYEDHQLFFEENIDDIKIKYTYRTVKDCLTFGHMHFHKSDENQKTFDYILYIVPQIRELSYKNEIIPTNEYIPFLLSRYTHEILRIFKALDSIDGKFGIKKNLKFKCKKCETVNNFKIFNNMSYSFITSAVNRNIYNDQRSLIKYLMNVSSIHSMSIKEFLDFPIRFDQQLTDVFNIAKVKQGSLFAIYNDGIG